MRKCYFAVIFLILMLMIACSIKDFEAPDFEKKIQLPLTNEIYYMEDLADTTDDYIVYVGNDTMMFSIEDDFETEYVGEDDLLLDGQIEDFDTQLGDDLTIESSTENCEVEVGNDLVVDETNKIIEKQMNTIEVEESGNAYADIEILEFACEAIEAPFEPIYDEIIPPYYDFDPFNQDFSLFENDNFEYVTIDTGSVYLSFFNNTELPLSSNLDEEFQMRFDFFTNGSAEADDGMFMFTHYIDHIIEPGELENIVIPFDGNTVYYTNYLKCYLTTDGSDGPIDITESDSFEVTFSVGNMTISEANAVIEAASVDNVSGVEFADDDIQISSAQINSCSGSILIENYLPFVIDTLRLEFHELYTEADELYSILETSIAQGDTRTIPIDMTGYSIEASSSVPLDSLSFDLYALTDPPPDYTLVTQDDMVKVTVDLGDMFLEEFTGIIDQITESNDTIDISDEDIEIASAEIAEGSLSFDFSGIDLQEQSTITVDFTEIIDPSTNEPLVLVINEFENYQYDLASHCIELNGEQILNYQTTVHLNQPITISESDIVNTNIVMSELYFESVSGIFESLEIDDNDAAEVDSTGEFNLFYAEIEDCQLHLNIPEEDYNLPFGAVIDLSFTDIFTPDGEPYSLNYHCPGDTIIDLAGFTLGNNPTSTIIIDSLYYSYIVTTDSSEGEIMTLYADQGIEAQIEISDIVFREVIGILDNREIELDDISEEIDLDDLPDSLSGLLEFQAVELHLNVQNQTGFDCRLTMDITASNDDGESSGIAVDETIFAEAETEIVISNGVNEMLNIIPDMINITNMTAYVGDGVSSGSIALNDSIAGNYNIVSPMQFIINDHTVTKTDDPEELDEDDQDIIEDHLNDAKVIVQAENTLPFGAEISLYLANDSLLIFTEPGLVIDSLEVNPATLGNEGIIPSQSAIEVELSGSDFDVFLDRENPFIYPGVKLDIRGSNGETVTIMGNDNLHITGILEINVHVVDTEE